MNILESTWTITGNQPGPTAAIIAGVHGDEPAGVEVIKSLRSNLVIERGTVHLVIANPPALKAGVRMIGKNLNRCFYADNRGSDPVDVRAREIMALLDTCDAMLDLHEHKDEATGPFIACEPPSFEMAESIGVPFITYSWLEAEPGATDSYMFERNKVGICFEAGSNTKTAENAERGRVAAERFLETLGIKPVGSDMSRSRPQYVEVLRAVHKQTDSFQLHGDWHTFDALPAGEVFATDGPRKYFAEAGEVIIFPRPQNPIGTEACIIGRFQEPPIPARRPPLTS